MNTHLFLGWFWTSAFLMGLLVGYMIFGYKVKIKENKL